jgi:predicted lipoprotein with Yx(FWY)xxD motif
MYVLGVGTSSIDIRRAHMRRTVLTTAAVLAVAAASAGSIAAAHGTAQTASGGSTVMLANTKLGKILVSRSGATLYLFTRDHGNDTCLRVSGCAAVWPPFTTKGRPVAGTGVRANLLGTITIGNGNRQVTYAGHPLYTYAAEPKGIDYVGANASGGDWEAVSAAGKAVGR